MKQKILRITITILVLILLSFGVYLIFNRLGLTNIEQLKELITSSGYLAIFVYILLFIAQSLFLQFIPLTGSALLIVSMMVFNTLGAAIVSTVAVYLVTIIAYYLGKLVPERVLIKLFGLKPSELDKAKQLVNSTNSKIAFPMMMLFPMFPDDALCFVAGISKMNIKYFILATFIPRTIGVFTFVYFGGLFVTLSLIEKIIVANLVLIDLYIVYKNKHIIEKWFSKKEVQNGQRTTRSPDSN